MTKHVLCILYIFIAAAGSVVGQTIRGVNLGGWLVTEQWITPSLYRGGALDEWTLCSNLGKSRCLSTLQNHWATFFTRDDFTQMKTAGLNSVRIPIGYWAVDVRDDEPFVTGQYPYLIRAVNWAQELGFTVLLDLHGAPGSQNGYDHSGRIGDVLFPSNSSNSDRALKVIANLTTEFSKDIYGGVVRGVQLLNEPRLGGNWTIDNLKDFYTNGSQAIWTSNARMNLTLHDAFWGPSYWSSYTPSVSSAARSPLPVTIDTHQYYAFPPFQNLAQDTILDHICNISTMLKSTSTPPAIVGEWSLETGKPPTAANGQSSSSSGSAALNNDQAKRRWFRLLFEAQVAGYEAHNSSQPSLGWYYWTWKTEWDIDTWSYRRGVAQQYIPSDVSNFSTFAFARLDNGCIDRTGNYTPPRNVGSGGGGGGSGGGSGGPYYGAAIRGASASGLPALGLGMLLVLAGMAVLY